jgi:hypothetical protein
MNSETKNIVIRLHLTDDEHDLVVRFTRPRERAILLVERALHNRAVRRAQTAALAAAVVSEEEENVESINP